MTLQSRTSLFVDQVAMTRVLIALYRDMTGHLVSDVMPHLDAPTRRVVEVLIEHLEHEDPTHPDLLIYLDTAIADIRKVIANGTTEERVRISAERLIGTSEAYDTRRSVTPAGAALQAALPPMERLFRAARDVHDFAHAISLTLDLIDKE